MKRVIWSLALAGTLLTTGSFTQTVTLSESLSLSLPGSGGSRGASVAWDPVKKYYYACFAGNSTFPMGVFLESGTRVSDADLTTQTDVRGLWYNPASKSVECNGYGDGGLMRYVCGSNGIPTGITVIHSGSHQPDGQSVGTYDSKGKQILFYHEGMIYSYGLKNGKQRWARAMSLRSSASQYNSTSVIWNPKRPKDAGLLNVEKRAVEYYNMSNGRFTASVELPYGAPVESSFNFAFANGYIWLFDMDSRTWKGYK